MKGKVLWWSERDQNGIIKDSGGNEFYFDRSVCEAGIKSDDLVKFEKNNKITDCLCACEVVKCLV